ncbi:MAG: hypothetical protein DYG88_15930 [Chloroflexi bacterium CFX4]|nr:hypothetical protein [Chloroflexi bacterium CFX4]MDL1921847.1 hypothetical protein [Chloroflexi bacterium CFX3]
MTDQPEYTDLHPEAAESPPPDAADDLPKVIPEESFSAPPYADDPNLAELLGRFVRAPRQTFELLRGTLYELPEDRLTQAAHTAHGAAPDAAGQAPLAGGERLGGVLARRTLLGELFQAPPLPVTSRQALLAVGIAALVLVAFVGSAGLQSPEARRSLDLPFGGFLLIATLVAATVVAIVNGFGLPLRRLPRLELPQAPPVSAAFSAPLDRFLAAHGLRLVLVVIGILSSLAAWLFNANNQFTTFGTLAWFASIAVWVGVFMPRGQGNWLVNALSSLRGRLNTTFRLRWSWTVAALVAILMLGAWLRVGDLALYLPDMTSDHVEKALDAQKVLNGDRSVFFPNNGGREVFQMYFIAFLHQVTGIPIGFELIKLASALEGLLTILLAYWLGRAMFGQENRQLGNLVGVLMAAMIAVSYWHVLLSRLGLRIILTPLLVTFVMVFLARGIRYNRRGDWIISGLALGIGLYFYQAVRMVPLLVIAAVLLALVLRARSWKAVRAYLFNATALVVISVAVFIPLARYFYDFPEFFLERTTGRIFGEDIIEIRNSEGEVIGQRAALVEDRIEAFQKNIGVFGETLRRSLLMFNFRGDTAWITGDPDGTPQLDPYSGAFFVLGLGMLFGRAVRRRDPAEWLLPIGILIMLLPSALALAYIIEVPSATRASGALPLVYLVAAFGMAVALIGITQGLPRLWLRRLVYAIAVIILLVSTSINYERYFVDAMRDYRNSTLPHRQVGLIMRGFAESTGALGNAFMIAFPNWLDHRALAIEAGDPQWGNGVLREDVISRILDFLRFNMGTRFELRPDRQMLFFFNPADETLVEELSAVFPNGTVIHIPAFKPDRDFNLYVTPPLGCEWVQQYLEQVSSYCADGIE